VLNWNTDFIWVRAPNLGAELPGDLVPPVFPAGPAMEICLDSDRKQSYGLRVTKRLTVSIRATLYNCELLWTWCTDASVCESLFYEPVLCHILASVHHRGNEELAMTFICNPHHCSDFRKPPPTPPSTWATLQRRRSNFLPKFPSLLSLVVTGEHRDSSMPSHLHYLLDGGRGIWSQWVKLQNKA
jgi:hypothetical protein